MARDKLPDIEKRLGWTPAASGCFDRPVCTAGRSLRGERSANRPRSVRTEAQTKDLGAGRVGPDAYAATRRVQRDQGRSHVHVGAVSDTMRFRGLHRLDANVAGELLHQNTVLTAACANYYNYV